MDFGPTILPYAPILELGCPRIGLQNETERFRITHAAYFAAQDESGWVDPAKLPVPVLQFVTVHILETLCQESDLQNLSGPELLWIKRVFDYAETCAGFPVQVQFRMEINLRSIEFKAKNLLCALSTCLDYHCDRKTFLETVSNALSGETQKVVVGGTPILRCPDDRIEAHVARVKERPTGKASALLDLLFHRLGLPLCEQCSPVLMQGQQQTESTDQQSHKVEPLHAAHSKHDIEAAQERIHPKS